MYPFNGTRLENQQGTYETFQQFFEQHGFEVGGNWQNDHGYFDKKLKDTPGYLFIRIPVMVEEGTFGERKATVRIGTPFLLRHQYQTGNDEQSSVDVFDAVYNQFSKPEDADASLVGEEIEEAREIVQQLEHAYTQENFRS